MRGEKSSAATSALRTQSRKHARCRVRSGMRGMGVLLPRMLARENGRAHQGLRLASSSAFFVVRPVHDVPNDEDQPPPRENLVRSCCCGGQKTLPHV